MGLADRGTVHIAGKGQRPRLRDERRNNSQAKPACEDQDQSLMSERQITTEDQGKNLSIKHKNEDDFLVFVNHCKGKATEMF